MGTPAENIARFQEISNRGSQDNLDPDKRARFDEALRRGLIQKQEFDLGQAASDVGRGIVGGLETAAAIGTGIIAEPVAGIAGIAQTINPFAGEFAGGEAVESVKEALTFAPRTEAGQETLGAVGKALEPVGKALTAAEEALGEKTLEVTGSPVLAAVAKSLPTAALEALGLGAPKIAAKVGQAGKEVAKQAARQSPFKQKVKQLIESGTPDDITAKFIINGAGKVRADPIAREAIKQGFDEGLVAAIKGSTPKDQSIMLKMMDVLKKGRTNKRFASENRPSDIIGDSVLNRFKFVVKSNKESGKRLDTVARSLKGKDVDFNPAVTQFIDDLEGMGVSIGGDLKPRFSGSDIEGLAAPENIIKRLVKRMTSGQRVDAHDVHRLKKFIDEQVTFGKSAEGLGGKTERILKSLRRNLDQSLDSTFPEYNAVNTKFSDTINALDDFKDAAGTKFNPLSDNADKFVGTLSRRLLSNVQSRVNLIDSLKGLQDTAVKYGAKFDDDIITQTMFADELSSLFGAPAKTGFEGGIEKAVRTAGRRRGAIDLGVDIAAAGAKKIRGVSEENAIKVMEQLLKRNKRAK